MKKIIFILTLLILVFSLAACGNSNDNTTIDNGGKASDTGNNLETFEYGNGSDYIASHLKGDYSITYRYSATGADDSLVVTGTRTADGFYYAMSDSEMLFIKNGNKYDMYSGSSTTGFTKTEYAEPYSLEMVEAQMVFVTGFMNGYGAYASDMTKDGSETIADRECLKYTTSFAGAGAALKLTYSIDKATGVCLKYTYDASAGGQSGGITYECTEFKTSGVSLPAYGSAEASQSTQPPETSPGQSSTPAASDGIWSGSWQISGSWGAAELTQVGDAVTGTYAHRDGKIVGAVSGNKLMGKWSQSETNTGAFEYVMSEDKMTFEVTWWYDGSTDAHTGDSGTRLYDIPSGVVTPQPSASTLADAKKNAQAAGHDIEDGFVAHTNPGVPEVKDGFYIIYNKDHKYDNLTVVELGSAADAKLYAAAVQEVINSAKVRYYGRFVLDVSIVDREAEMAFTDDMAKQVMKDLFGDEGIAAAK